MRVRRRDARELSRLYNEHVRAVYGHFAYSVSPDVAEDLTSATFERVIRAWHRYDPARASERTWILTIATNVLRDHYRRQRFRAGPSLDQNPQLLGLLERADSAAGPALPATDLVRWLSHLSNRDRQVLALRYAGDLDTEAIAQALGLSEPNVHQIISRSLRRLRAVAEEAQRQTLTGR